MQADAVRSVVEPVVVSLGLELFDLTVDGRTLEVTIDRDGGVDLDALTQATERVSAALDAADAGDGSYALEVTSPGLERPLRTPGHFRRSIGATVSVKARDDAGDVTRHRGVLVAADDAGCTVDGEGGRITLSYDALVQAHTVFEWGPTPKPRSGGRPKRGGDKTNKKVVKK